MNNAVFLEERQFERMVKEVPKILCITRAVLCEKFKVGGAVARALIRELEKKGLIKPVGLQHHSFDLYTGSQAKPPGAADEDDGKKKKKNN